MARARWSVLHDVAIYMPQAKGLYERGIGRGGGAERQTHLLARALSEAGLDVAHIVFPIRNPVPSPHPRLAVVQRAPQGRRLLDEPRRVWQALARASARTYVVRTATPALGVTGLFCRVHRCRLIFASANDGDFTFETIHPRSLPLYKLGVRLADAVVVQSATQVDLTRRVFPRVKRVEEIPSFVDVSTPAAARNPQAFLWIGRIVEYKQPMRYLDLAAALPEARFRMIQVVHDAPRGMQEAIRARAADLANVELLEARSHEATMEQVRAAIGIVNTSRVEGMPNVFLEAWSNGVPVIALQCDPDGRIKRHGLGIAADGSWDRFVEGARKMWNQRADLSRYKQAAGDYLANTHGKLAVTSRWVEVIGAVQ